MAYSVEWAVPGHVVLLTLTGDITIPEIAALIADAEPLTLSASHPVHYIVYVHDLGSYPLSLRQLSAINYGHSASKVGWWMVVGAGTMAAFAVTVLAHVLNVRAKTASTVEDAMAILYRLDPALMQQAG